ncbi:hypothetical protein [Ethanoligenens harbinense]|uniref:Uncharacterized protein n=1 Tax=Ethanoligenens harbinense (strain DSM 18485 / JCM 12961 / CGMCC 1.5033 / YUAN-3) TaxID=663278 RepID=E6U932_ETHHY|nr:hypothetical protein [Ethanoligenens harbinense]ADU26096.1 hypothetical protein Ethha_0511 [Ethanoligenens harbinense YUAN-3]AVQ95239.1 hypothetical protein CXQ68_02650 [Ethanoligenens harbinense YUAN-3]AYF37930.1 hypothetical protein CXP51_02665 [Ethanoligenens harbinense]AYF40650.1 hypothetical protein CN246_02650 [Ethanoligenens harbinense]QCN91484.1 hypothetical protein DRA42_02660 [Ethanoligenens harbinense]
MRKLAWFWAGILFGAVFSAGGVLAASVGGMSAPGWAAELAVLVLVLALGILLGYEFGRHKAYARGYRRGFEAGKNAPPDHPSCRHSFALYCEERPGRISNWN